MKLCNSWVCIPALLLCSGCSSTFVSAHTLFIGDSITYFWGQADNFADKGWIDIGISGQQCVDLLNRFRLDVIDVHPGKVHILCGTNDIWTGSSDLTTSEGNIAAMVSQARAANIPVILGTLPPVNPDKGVYVFPTSMNAQILVLNTWIHENYEAREGIKIVDYHAALSDRHGYLIANYTDDGAHPNAQGFKVMTSAAMAALR